MSLWPSNASGPSTPFRGLRNSWLIMVRNRDLARLASSACSALRRLISAICLCRRFSRRIRKSDSTLTSTAARLMTAVVRALDWIRSRTWAPASPSARITRSVYSRNSCWNCESLASMAGSFAMFPGRTSASTGSISLRYSVMAATEPCSPS